MEDYADCFRFDQDRPNITLGEVTLNSGTTAEDEDEDPLPLYQRGMYFDGA